MDSASKALGPRRRACLGTSKGMIEESIAAFRDNAFSMQT